ncbi:MAG: ferritin family protein [Victivallaceae bacterium]|jgi:rubrerythrin
MSINYDIADLISNMIELETCGAEFYSSLAEKYSNPIIKQLFARLAEQENGHRILYERLLEKTAPETGEIDDEYQYYLREIIDRKFDLDVRHALTCVNPQEVLDMAVRLENDSIKFVNAFGVLTGTAYRELVEQIKNQEQGHLAMLLEIKSKI